VNYDDVIVDIEEDIEATKMCIKAIEFLMLDGGDRDSLMATLIEESERLDKLSALLSKLRG